MHILLIGVDYKEVNIALGKYSTHHKSKGDRVTIKHLGLDGYPSKKHITVDASAYDKTYISQLFDVNQGKWEVTGCKEIEIGGVGSLYPKKKLPAEIEHLEIDYSLFDTDTSFGFITKGCPNKCYFCKVPVTEGELYRYQDIDDIIRHKQVKFMDNNFLAYEGHKDILKELVKRGIRCQFNQGLDIRRIDDEDAELLSNLNYMGEYTFAFDNIKQKLIIEKGLNIAKKHIPKAWKIKFYIYHNTEFTSIADSMNRVEWLRERECLPYLMRDINCWESKDSDFLIDYAAYCNQPNIFKKMTFEQFLVKRHTRNDRIVKSLETYKNNMEV